MTGSECAVEFYFGVGSRYSYLAATQIERLAKTTGANFEWRPIISSELIASLVQNPFQWDDEKKDWSGAQMSGQYSEAYRRTDLARWAAFYGVPYCEPEPPAMEAARRTLYAVAATVLGVGQPYSQGLLDVIYAKGLPTDEALCRALAVELNLNPDEITALVESGEAAETHDRWIKRAKSIGLFGVPSFVVGEHVFWGNDRLPLLEAALNP